MNNIRVMWNQALNEYSAAKCMFDYAISKSHTDIAISAMIIAEKRLDMIRELALLNRMFVDENKRYVKKSKFGIIFDRVKMIKNKIKRGVKRFYV